MLQTPAVKQPDVAAKPISYSCAAAPQVLAGCLAHYLVWLELHPWSDPTWA